MGIREVLLRHRDPRLQCGLGFETSLLYCLIISSLVSMHVLSQCPCGHSAGKDDYGCELSTVHGLRFSNKIFCALCREIVLESVFSITGQSPSTLSWLKLLFCVAHIFFLAFLPSCDGACFATVF